LKLAVPVVEEEEVLLLVALVEVVGKVEATVEVVGKVAMAVEEEVVGKVEEEEVGKVGVVEVDMVVEEVVDMVDTASSLPTSDPQLCGSIILSQHSCSKQNLLK
jgi:hypothetical protein